MPYPHAKLELTVRLSKSIVGDEEARAVARVILEDGYLGMGKETRDFENALASCIGVEPWQVVSVNSGTAALHLACQAITIEEEARIAQMTGKPEIIIPSLTFVASFQAALAAGFLPVACDVLTETGTIDLEDAQNRITSNTIAIMPVDYASNPWKLDETYAFARERNLRVVEDAAHAFGCRHHGKKIGSFGDLVCFSFDGIKNITCGEGGCIIAFARESAELCADGRLLGVVGDTAKRFAGARSWDADVIHQGWRYHLSNIMAAIGLAQLERLEDEFIPARNKLYNLYRENLADAPNIIFFRTDPEDYIVPHILPLRIVGGKKDIVAYTLKQAGIPTGLHYKPNHLLSLFGAGAPTLPNVEKLYGELLTVPLHPGLSEADVLAVCGVLRSAAGEDHGC